LLFSFFVAFLTDLFPDHPDSSIQNAVSDVGFSRAGIAAAVAVPLVAIGGLALLSPLALGRKRRDLDGLEGERINIKLTQRIRLGN
jgi:hypothetical protein